MCTEMLQECKSIAFAAKISFLHSSVRFFKQPFKREVERRMSVVHDMNRISLLKVEVAL
jgi:hypothetical protein